jgi:hypothetical protein
MGAGVAADETVVSPAATWRWHPPKAAIEGNRAEATERRQDMNYLVLGHRPTAATATIHVARRLLQRHDGGGRNQNDRHVKTQVTGLCVPCPISRAGPGFRSARRVERFADWNRARIRRFHRMSQFRRTFRRPGRSRSKPSRSKSLEGTCNAALFRR